MFESFWKFHDGSTGEPSIVSIGVTLACAGGGPNVGITTSLTIRRCLGIILVTDLRSESIIAGDGAESPSNEHTVLAQVPFENDEIPAHTVLGTGSCSNNS